MAGIKATEPDVARRLVSEPQESSGGAARITPWRGFLRSGPVRPGPADCQGDVPITQTGARPPASGTAIVNIIRHVAAIQGHMPSAQGMGLKYTF